MKYLAIPVLLLCPMLMACPASTATKNAEAVMQQEVRETDAARVRLFEAKMSGAAEEAIKQLQAEYDKQSAELKDAIVTYVDSAKADTVAGAGGVARTGATIFGLGPAWAEMLGSIVAGLAAQWQMRDSRKRKGTDPLQNPNIPTPPVVSTMPTATVTEIQQ